MNTNKALLNVFTAALVPPALFAIGWAAVSEPHISYDAGLLTLAAVTVFSSCFLRIKLPRVSAHFTISNSLLILALVTYGGPSAILISVIESAVASLYMRRLGIKIGARSTLVNISIAAISVFATAHIANYVFGPTNVLLQRNDFTSFVWLLVVMTVSIYLFLSLPAAVYTSLKTDKSPIDIWTSNVVQTGVMYLADGFLAGIIIKTVEQFNIYLIGAVVIFFGLLYITFKHFMDDVTRSTDIAKQAEQERAEQAEQHVRELEHYVEELERSGEALRISHENFRHAAYHDALTGLPNRNFFIDRLKSQIQMSTEADENSWAILLLDLNRFKTINDSLGHSMGDRLIRNVAKRLANLVDEKDMVARFSGDKFGIILTGLGREDDAIGFSDRLSKRIAEPYTLDGRQVFTNVKVGIAFGNSKYTEAEDLLRDADIAMYHAKDQNENCVIFDQKMHVRAVTRMQLETDLRFAIERNEFEVYFQPIIGLDSANLVGFEALVRWNHPQRGLIPPYEFIPISENTGLIVPMTVQILHSACSQVKYWQDRFPSTVPLSIAVNLSGKHFAHPSLVEQINSVLAETHIPPSSLKLELTESAVMENAEMAIQMLKQIKQTGVQLSIDDFGTGYSSLSYLHRFPIDLLKVDRSFVSAMEDNTENGEIVRTVIALAKALNLKVVAEGIESIHQFHQLRILGCEYGQGYLFSKPLRAADAERLIEDRSRWKNILPAQRPQEIQSTSQTTVQPQNPGSPQLRLA